MFTGGAAMTRASPTEGRERDHPPGHVPAIVQRRYHAPQVGAGDGGQIEGIRREPYQGRLLLRRTRVRSDKRGAGGEVIRRRLIALRDAVASLWNASLGTSLEQMSYCE